MQHVHRPEVRALSRHNVVHYYSPDIPRMLVHRWHRNKIQCSQHHVYVKRCRHVVHTFGAHVWRIPCTYHPESHFIDFRTIRTSSQQPLLVHADYSAHYTLYRIVLLIVLFVTTDHHLPTATSRKPEVSTLTQPYADKPCTPPASPMRSRIELRR